MSATNKPSWFFQLPLDLIHLMADRHGLDRNFLCALVMKESGGNARAVRYEPHFKYFYFAREYAEKLGVTCETETQLQKFSYGLGQVMGAVARERGYKGELILLASDAGLGLEFACLQLAWLKERVGGNEARLFASYNGGLGVSRLPSGMYSNQRYVDQACAFLRELRQLTV